MKIKKCVHCKKLPNITYKDSVLETGYSVIDLGKEWWIDCDCRKSKKYASSDKNFAVKLWNKHNGFLKRLLNKVKK